MDPVDRKGDEPGDRRFAGSIPQRYQQLLVPLIFEPYAADMAQRTAALRPARVLEIAAGTGVVTRELARRLDPGTAIVATDLNQPMLDLAAAIGTVRTAANPVQWRQADAMKLPFPDAGFDAVVCQFGVMFFPDKAVAWAEARRVLRPGGTLLFSAWDRIEDNEFADAVTDALAPLYPASPPRFMARIPHGYHDKAVIAADVARGGFDRAPTIDTIAERSLAGSPRDPAVAYCQGTPLRNEIEAQAAPGLAEATAAAAAEVERRFGSGAVDGRIQAHVVTVSR